MRDETCPKKAKRAKREGGLDSNKNNRKCHIKHESNVIQSHHGFT